MNKIDRFRGKNSFLSNFYPCIVEFDGKLYPSAEHAFQAAKTLDDDERENFRVMDSPATARYWGRRVNLRPDWDEVKLQVMRSIVENKFTNEYNKQYHIDDMLRDTGTSYLEEGNNHSDKYWGTVNGEGQNHLGKILMSVRDEISNNENTLK